MKNEADHKNENEYDDFTLISGIGQTRQQWLQEKLHIYSFRDLAALSVSEILNKMKAEGQIISKSRVESWVKQAQQFVDSAGEKLPLTVRDDGWKPFAAFVVEFQTHQTADDTVEWRTKAHHMEADQTKMWVGIEHDELCAWMIQHLGIETEVTPAAVEVAEARPEFLPTMEPIQPLAGMMQAEAITTSLPERKVQGQLSSGFSARYYRLLAKVQEATAATTHSTGLVQAQSAQDVSERYERLLAKVEQETTAISRPMIPATPPASETMSRYERLLAKVQQETTATSRPMKPEAPPAPETMSRYERLLARVREQEQSAR